MNISLYEFRFFKYFFRSFSIQISICLHIVFVVQQMGKYQSRATAMAFHIMWFKTKRDETITTLTIQYSEIHFFSSRLMQYRYTLLKLFFLSFYRKIRARVGRTTRASPKNWEQRLIHQRMKRTPMWYRTVRRQKSRSPSSQHPLITVRFSNWNVVDDVVIPPIFLN